MAKISSLRDENNIFYEQWDTITQIRKSYTHFYGSEMSRRWSCTFVVKMTKTKQIFRLWCKDILLLHHSQGICLLFWCPLGKPNLIWQRRNQGIFFSKKMVKWLRFCIKWSYTLFLFLIVFNPLVSGYTCMCMANRDYDIIIRNVFWWNDLIL